MKKNKILAIVLVFGIIFAGCGGGAKPANSESSFSAESIATAESSKSESVDEVVAIDDTNLKEIKSEAWKQAVWDFIKNYHEKQIDHFGSGYEQYFDWLAYNISLYNVDSEDNIGIKVVTQTDPQHGNSDFYAVDDGSLNLVASAIGVSVYYNIDNGDIDFLSAYTQDGGFIYAECFSLNNGKWKSEAVYNGDISGNHNGDISYDQYQEIYDQIKENHELYESPDNIRIGYQNKATLRAAPWSDVAVEFSKFLDSFDGIKIDLAGKEGYEPVEVDETIIPEWADSYAKLAQDIVKDESGDSNKISDFTLMDIDFDGTPEFIIKRYHYEGYEILVYKENWNSIDDRFNISDPLRFFKNDKTSDIIFSSLYENGYGMQRLGITYTHAKNGESYRLVMCSRTYDDTPVEYREHVHILADSDNLYSNNTIERIELPIDAPVCDYEFGVNSSTPSIAKFAVMALRGYTELPKPEKYEHKNDAFVWDIDESVIYDIKAVQDWIYKTAELY